MLNASKIPARHKNNCRLVASSAVGAAATVSAPATATTAAPAATIAAATAAAATGGALRARPGFVNRQGPAVVVEAVQRFDGLLGLAVVFHFHKAEATRAPGLLVRDHLGPGHLAVLFKQLQQVVGGCIPHEIADVNILRHSENLSVPAPNRSHTTKITRNI